MVLPMPRPFAHRKTGVYWVRKAIPAPLRAVVGGKWELTRTLGTKCPKEARARAPVVLAQLEAIVEAARNGGSPVIPLRDIDAAIGGWYRAEFAKWADDPGTAEHWDDYAGYYADMWQGETGDDRDFMPDRDFLGEAEALLRRAGFLPSAADVRRAAERWAGARIKLGQALERRAQGDWREDPTLAEFPMVPTKGPAMPSTAPSGVAFGSLVAAWAAEAGTTAKARYDRERTAASLARFLGHDDAARVTADDAIRWKEARIAEGKALKTVANDIGELRPIWKWAKANRKLHYAENPFAGIAPRPKRTAQSPRTGYTEDEARSVLKAARSEAASLRWLPWLACFTGARIGEIAQSDKADIQRDGASGPWFLHIHADGDGRTIKTVQSARKVPLHPAIIREGFLDYVASLPAGSPLFPNLRVDTFGTRKDAATKQNGRWVRRTVGITDRRKDPAHAWRHRFEDEARRILMPQPVIDGMLGHKATGNESGTYGRGYGQMPATTAAWLNKMASPFDTSEQTEAPPEAHPETAPRHHNVRHAHSAAVEESPAA